MSSIHKVWMGSDHAGIGLRTHLCQKMQERYSDRYLVEVVGPKEESSSDYPDVAFLVAQRVIDTHALGILICGTGVGVSIAANKVPGIRCALVSDATTARLSREHNDANVLALGARILGQNLAWDIVVAWLEEPFSGFDRHQQRLAKIRHFEKTECGR